ncbi:MAG TPA: hypothetical protein VHX66_03350 [Solirubrobacteraceae bacterium]|nr:hypothetical protein [Solirubrobacteraceae bacterium]
MRALSSIKLRRPGGGEEQDRRKRRRLAALALAAGAFAVEAVGLRRRGYRLGGNVVVRCRSGHLFTTLWIPLASVKAARLGLWRFQRCPVGRHWSIVTPVRESMLSPEELRAAQSVRDLRVP